MITSGSIKRVREASRRHQQKGELIGFVPTMGALHKGHLSLVKRAREECDFLVVSIFVNPTQFGPKEDYCRYPRNLSQDKRLLEKEGVDLLFSPNVNNIYPSGVSVYVDEGSLSKLLCGRPRPGHFRGVVTILTKLFNIIEPDIVYFGQKDYQQTRIVKRLIDDLNFSLRLRVSPIIREEDGLAMSSRNVCLDSYDRDDCGCLYEALSLARKLIREGCRNSQKVIDQMKQVVKSKKLAKINYIAIVDADNLKRLTRIRGKVLIALAVYIKKVRLIDNIILNVKG
ncbi:MAG: pantoate--beta-alanine ligase [Candidatus Omnitrophota bacterium]